jgi:hypothetical protein
MLRCLKRTFSALPQKELEPRLVGSPGQRPADVPGVSPPDPHTGGVATVVRCFPRNITSWPSLAISRIDAGGNEPIASSTSSGDPTISRIAAPPLRSITRAAPDPTTANTSSSGTECSMTLMSAASHCTTSERSTRLTLQTSSSLSKHEATRSGRVRVASTTMARRVTSDQSEIVTTRSMTVRAARPERD